MGSTMFAFDVMMMISVVPFRFVTGRVVCQFRRRPVLEALFEPVVGAFAVCSWW
jgi:hypothetical protein